ncbi:MAG: hypothetical protein KAX49_13535 [Halanaerobiales bacterium]|nr:hypothetical protein [Halanaerobiales bacterium]
MGEVKDLYELLSEIVQERKTSNKNLSLKKNNQVGENLFIHLSTFGNIALLLSF